MDKKKRIESLEEEAYFLIQANAVIGSEEFSSWYKKCTYTLQSIFGDKSYEYKEFISIHFQKRVYNAFSYDQQKLEDTRNGLKVAITLLSNISSNLEEEVVNQINIKKSPVSLDRVLIVYGHNDGLKQKISRLLEKQGIKVVALNEVTDVGLTIIEKFEKYSNCGAAICLFSADDFGNSILEESTNKRARQNVVFETGYFVGKMGRNKTIIVSDKNIEMPSDLDGVIYIDANNYEVDILKSLKSIGFNVDLNKII